MNANKQYIVETVWGLGQLFVFYIRFVSLPTQHVHIRLNLMSQTNCQNVNYQN